MKKWTALLAVVTVFPAVVAWSAGPLVLQSDFGVKDSAVASMKGVAVSVSRDLVIYDLTHEVPTYNIWEASLRLAQAAEYWPKGTVFVSVVDPGVGTERKSVVLKTKSGHYFVSPDNGSLTAVAEQLGVEAVREIDEAVNRLAIRKSLTRFMVAMSTPTRARAWRPMSFLSQKSDVSSRQKCCRFPIKSHASIRDGCTATSRYSTPSSAISGQTSIGRRSRRWNWIRAT